MTREDSYSYDTYLSPFTWRYGSEAMRRLWSEQHKRLLWRRIWVALAEAQMAAGLVRAEQVADLAAHRDQVDLARAQEIEADIHHDLMAEVRTYAEQCPGAFAATKRLLMELVKRGGDRQALHETIREHALAAWAALRAGSANPLVERLAANPAIGQLASAVEVRGWLAANDYVGDAPQRARRFAASPVEQLR